MKLRNGMTVGLLVFGIAVSLTAGRAAAAPNTLVPTTSEIELPKFGFESTNVPGVGDRIDSLTADGRFAKLGVEVGDIILSVNGFNLTQSNSWRPALLKARAQKATTLHLRILDVRTKKVRTRDISVSFAVAGPLPAVQAEILQLKKELLALKSQRIQLQQDGGIQAEAEIVLLNQQMHAIEIEIAKLGNA